MNTFVGALLDVEKQFTEEKGEFALFACFEPAELQDQWDLLVSAAWAPRHNQLTLRRLASALDEMLAPTDRLRIGRIAIVEPSDEDVQRINAKFAGDQHPWEIRNEEYFGYTVARGFVLASHDYWKFVKDLFPTNASFVFFTREGDLHIRVSWKLGTDALRPHKSSKIIIIRITREVLDGYIYIDDSRRHEAERRLVAELRRRLRSHNAEHSKSANDTPPIEEWKITTRLFDRAAATA